MIAVDPLSPGRRLRTRVGRRNVGRRSMRRRLLRPAGWLLGPNRRPAPARWRRVRGPSPAGHVAPVRAVEALSEQRSAGPVMAGAAGALGVLVGGPVAGALLAVYGGVGWLLVRRRMRGRRFARERVAAVDAVSKLAPELRAGLPGPGAFAAREREPEHPPGPGGV